MFEDPCLCGRSRVDPCSRIHAPVDCHVWIGVRGSVFQWTVVCGSVFVDLCSSGSSCVDSCSRVRAPVDCLAWICVQGFGFVQRVLELLSYLVPVFIMIDTLRA